MHSDFFKLRDWDSGLPDTFAMQRFRSNLLDTAIVMNGAETANGLGLAHEVLSGADHQAILGQVSAPIPEPEDYAGPEARMRNQGRLFHKYGIQQRLIPILRSLVISGLPDRILRLAEINGSTRHHAHTFDLLDDIAGKIFITNADLAFARKGSPSRTYEAPLLDRTWRTNSRS